MKKINSQEDLDSLIANPVWGDAFIRECHALSQSYVYPESRGLFAAGASSTIKVLVCAQDIEYPGIELLFLEAEDVSLAFRCDLDPQGKFCQNYIEFSFIESEGGNFRCKEIYYRLLDQSCWGLKTRYGNENFYAEDGFLDSKIFED